MKVPCAPARSLSAFILCLMAATFSACGPKEKVKTKMAPVTQKVSFPPARKKIPKRHKTPLPPGVIRADVSKFLVDPAFPNSIHLICTKGDGNADLPEGIRTLGSVGRYYEVVCNASQKQY